MERICDRVAFMKDGRLVAVGTLAQMLPAGRRNVMLVEIAEEVADRLDALCVPGCQSVRATGAHSAELVREPYAIEDERGVRAAIFACTERTRPDRIGGQDRQPRPRGHLPRPRQIRNQDDALGAGQMDLNYTGKRCLVTASTGGLGFAIARCMAAEGANVVVNGRSDETTATAAEKIAAEVPDAAVETVVGNSGTAEGCAAIIEACPDVDVLVINLGIYEAVDIYQAGDDHWYDLIEINVMSGVRLARHYLPRMLARDSGRVIFMASESAHSIRRRRCLPTAPPRPCKLSLARNLAETTKSTNVTVNSVLPGPCRTRGRSQADRRPLSRRGDRGGRAPLRGREPSHLSHPAPVASGGGRGLRDLPRQHSGRHRQRRCAQGLTAVSSAPSRKGHVASAAPSRPCRHYPAAHEQGDFRAAPVALALCRWQASSV